MLYCVIVFDMHQIQTDYEDQHDMGGAIFAQLFVGCVPDPNRSRRPALLVGYAPEVWVWVWGDAMLAR